jgi:osmoprotectant transport system substrate-binding protein
MRMRRLSWVVALALAAALAGAGGESSAAGSLRIGSKNFTEQVILGELYARALEARGTKVERKLNLGGTLIAHRALVGGEIDLYPEYTGTALLNILKAERMTDAAAVYEKVKGHYEREFKVTWLQPAPLNNTYVLVVRPETAAQHGLKTLSDLARVSKRLKLGAGAEFRDRQDGIPGLRATYGMEFAEDRQFATPLKYEALRQKRVDVVSAFATDGQIGAYQLVSLVDDKRLWPPYNVAPVIRMQALQDHPQVAPVLNQVNALLTDRVMSELNFRVDGKKEEPKDVARDFLQKHGVAKK